MGIRFIRDAVKSDANQRKHRVSFAEALTVFTDPRARIHDDPAHSEGETREIIVGHSIRARLLMVSFTDRYGAVRIISARRATSHESNEYERQAKA